MKRSGLRSSPRGPAFLEIARDIIVDIQSGVLCAGEPLPSSRAHALSLGRHRNTVLAAYAELQSQGWIETEPGRGTFVCRELPIKIAVKKNNIVTPNYRYNASPAILTSQIGEGILHLGGGLPDVRLLPLKELSRFYRNSMEKNSLFDYSDPQGNLALRSAIVAMLRETRGIVRKEENILITRGSQMGIWLFGQTLLRKGDIVAVESIGYKPAWRALAMSGAKLTPIPVDQKGMRIDVLEKRHKKKRIHAIYLTPHHQFPTLVTLSASRRLKLLEFAARNQIAILEDDYDHEFHYEGRPVLPMASDCSFGNVVYIGTMSKILAPGLRIGFLVAPAFVVNSMAALRSHVDGQGSGIIENAMAEYIEQGALARHARRMRKIYQYRRKVLAEALTKQLSDALSFSLPSGGMALWAKVDSKVDVDAWTKRALTAGVKVSPASLYRMDGRNEASLRLGFAKLNEDEIEKAVGILSAAL